MNKQSYRIVFNQSRGCLMAVAENATSQGKSPNGERAGAGNASSSCTFTAIAWACKLMGQAVFVSAAALWLAPFQTQAQTVATRIVADPTAARTQQATILNTSNGVVQVNIQTPSAAGVSRNTYSQFDVGNQGAILNNSRTNVQTQQGGWVQGNPWLATGSARVILNEVNASNPSQLQGYVEVAGQRAEVIIANPAGIAVSGGGFINASGVTLTTGTPVMNSGNLDSYRVQRGSVRVDGQGLDTRTSDYTAILARAAQVNAGIWAKQLQVVTGANEVQAASIGVDTTPQTTALAASGSLPTYALDVSQLGGMYAGKITLIGTEAGVGVRNAGLLQASTGALTLTHEGWLSNSGTLQATGGDVHIQTRGTVDQSGTVYSDKSVQLTSQSGQTHSGTVAALGDVNIQAMGTQSDGQAAHIAATNTTVWAAGLKTDGQLTGQQNLQIQASGQVQTAGKALATDTLSMQGASLDLTQSRQQASILKLQANTGDLKASGSQILVAGTLQLQTTQALTTDSAEVQAQTLKIQASSLSNVAGHLIQTGSADQSIKLQGSLNNTAGVIQSNANHLDISAQSVDNTAGQLLHAGTGTFSLSSQGTLTHNTQSGTQAAVTDGARIVSSGSLNIASGDWGNSGSVYAAKDLTTTTTSLNNSGVLYAEGHQTLTVANAITSSGTIAAGKDLGVNANSFRGTSVNVVAAGMAADGKLTGTGTLSMSATGALQSAGQTLGTGQVTLNGGSLDLNHSTTGSTNDNLSLVAHTGDILTQGAQISTPGLLAITANSSATQKLDNRQGLLSGQQLDIRTGQLDNIQGHIQQTGTGVQTANIQTADALDNSGGAIVANAQALSILAGGTFVNADGLISAARHLNIASGDLRNIQTTTGNNAKGIQSQSGHIQLQVQKLTNSGNIYAAQDLTATATQITNSGNLYAAGVQTLSASGAVTNSGTLAAGQDLTLSAASFSGTTANVMSAGMAPDGKLTGTGALSVDITGALQSAGQVLATGNVALQGASLDLSHSTTASTAGDLSLKATGGDILAQSAKVSTPGQLTVMANATGTQKLDNRQGQISAAQLNLHVSHINNAQGSMEQTGSGDLTLNLQGGALDNTAGRLVANAQNISLSTGQLTNTDGLIGHAGTGQLTITVSSQDNTRGQVLGNGRVSLTSTGNVINADGLVSAQGDLYLSSADLSNTRSAQAPASTGIQSQTGQITLSTQTLTNTGIIYAAQDLTTTATALSNSGTMYASGNQTLTVANAISNSGTIAATKKLGVTAANFAGTPTSVLAAGMADNGALIGTGALSVNTTGALQSAGQLLATGNVTLQGASLDLRGTSANGSTTASVVGSTTGDVSFSASTGNVLTSQAQVSTPGQLTVSANAMAGQLLDNSSGQLSAKALQIQVGQLNNTQGVIQQTGTGVQTASIQSTDAINNSSGNILANAQNLSVSAGGPLTNTDGLIAHAGTGQFTLSASSLDNTRGQVLGNGSALLSSTGNVINTDGLISLQKDLEIRSADLSNTVSATPRAATGIQSQTGNLTLSTQALSSSTSLYAGQNLTANSTSLSNSGTMYAAGNQTLTVANAITNSGTLASAKDLGVTTASFIGSSTSVLAAGMADNGALIGTGALSVNTTGALQSAGQLLATGNVTLQGASLDLRGTSANGSTTASVVGSTTGDVSFSASTGNVLTSQAQVSTPGQLTVSANAMAGQLLDNSSGQLSAKALQIQVGQLNNTQGVIQQTGTGVQTASIQSTDAINNISGNILANAQNLSVSAGGSLNNTDGQIGHAGADTFNLNTAATDNTRGKILGNGALSFTATGDVNNTNGLVAAQSLNIVATGWNNSQGKLLSTETDLSLRTSQNAVTNAGGLIQSAQDLSLSLTGAGNTLQNSQGKIYAGRDATLSTGALTNDAALIAAGRKLSIDTHGQSLSNLDSRASSTPSTPGTNAVHLGLIAGEQMDIASGGLDNRAGLISAQGALNVTSSGAINNASNNSQASQIYSGASLNLQATGVDNTASQILAVGSATLNLGVGSLTNTSALVRVGQTLTVRAGSVDNTATQASNNDGSPQAMGLEGQTVALTTANLNNTQGAVRATQDLSIQSDGLITNDQGELSAGRHLQITTHQASTPTLRINNAAGQIVADTSVDVTTGSLSGAGTLASKGDVSLSLQGNHTLAGTLQAGGHLNLSATGQITNPISVQAGQNLTVSAQNLDNQATGELQSGQTTQLNVAGSLTNRGLIDGADTRIQAGSVNNLGTGRIYGDRVAIAAGTLTNQEETLSGVTQAAAIAGRERLDIGSQTLSNRENALIYSAGDMALGGALDASWRATGSAQLLNNNSATIEAAQNLSIQATSLRNTNEHFATEVRQTSQTALTQYQHAPGDTTSASDNSTHFAPAEVSITDCQATCMTTAAGTSDAFVRYDYTRTVQESVVTQSAPSKILAGGGISLLAGNVLNDKSQIVAGGSLNVQATSLNNVQGEGTRNTTDVGTATSYWRVRQKGTDTTGSSASNYAPAPAQETINLSVSRYEQNTVTASTGTAPLGSTLSTVSAQASTAGTVAALSSSAGQSTITGTQASTATSTSTATQTGAQAQSSATAAVQAQSLSTPSTTGQPVSTGHASSAQAQGGSTVTRTAAQIQALSGASAQGTATPSAANAKTASAQTAIRMVQPSSQIPNTSLFKTHPEVGAKYLVETDPQYTNNKTWLGSDYMLGALNLDPATTQKRMGDGFYEQKLVREQVQALTGQRFLGNYSNDQTQYMALMNNGLTYAKALNLRPGIALSAEQVAQLTSDMVWLVTQEVTLADGSKQSVLVPQVYVRVQPGDVDGTGALLAGRDVQLNLSADATNSGTIAGRNLVQINANNIQNMGGNVSGAAVALLAEQDINNIGGQIQVQSAALLSARRDINISTTTQSSTNRAGNNSFAQTGIDRVAGLYVSGSAGVLIASAGRDLNLTAAQISNQGTGLGSGTTLSAAQNINLGTVTTSSSQDIRWSGVNYLRQSNSQDVGSQINTTGNLTLSAGQDLNAKAATINAGQTLSVAAQRDVNITTGQASQSLDTANTVKSKGLMSSRTLNTRQTSQSTTAVASNLEGASVSISAGQDLTVKGSNVLADQSVNLNAGRNVNIEAAQNTQSQTDYRQETKSGLMSGGGIGFTVGKRQQSLDQQGQSTSAAQSTIGAINGNVTINAGGAFTQTGSDVLTPKGDIDIKAKAINIQEARETGSQSTEQKFKQSGLTVAITSPVLSALQTVQSQLQAAGNTSSGRMQALAGANAAMNLKQAVDAVKAGQGDAKGQVPTGNKNPDGTPEMKDANAADKAGGIGISISVGSSSSQSKQSSSADNARGSSINAGGNITIQATGAGKDSNLTLQGSSVQAAGTTRLQADNQVNLLAAQNTTSESSSNQSKSASVGVAAQLGNGGGGIGFTASVSKATGQGAGNSVTYTNTQVAGNTVNIESGGDTTLKGAVVKADQVTAQVGGNLTIQSLQDTNQYKESSKSAGGSIMVGAGVSGSVNLAKSSINSNYQSVGEQSAIRAGDGGFQVEVKGNTTLTGAQITSTQAAIDKNKNSFQTGGTLTATDLQNKASYEAKSVSVGLGAGALPGKSASAGMSGVGFGSDSGNAGSTSTAGISGVAGNTAARTGDKSTSIAPIFDADKVKKEIEAQVTITQEFGKQAGKAITEYTNGQRKTLQEQAKNASTAEDKAKAEQSIKDVNMQERALNILTAALTGMTGSVITKEALSTAAEKMRDLMVEDSKKFAGVVDSTGKVLSNVSGPSEGVRGDGTKVGGTRVDLDLLCGSDNARCTFSKNPDGSIDASKPVVFDGRVKPDGTRETLDDFLKTPEGQKLPGATGGVQGAVGTLFGVPYAAGSWQDKLIESFAGTHDFIGGKVSGLYDAQGNAARGRSELTTTLQNRWSEIAILPAAPFAAAEGLSPEVWKAIGILLGAGK